ncbi:hypothetical protein GCM10010112_29750 [Actinoplanes lobatus]|uniref:DUF72 domain-containing protein n=1 Tax=Actinoplanes lobatus TaxID=113568 RepID=A0A7W7MLE3_9ACTN|nr:hypothetical protein [Actinoplanes lobatus]GGN66868.1 hypothetical protein GCM10010112_29750 [Actinoplanes lobatus]GIE42463.1 hypothetical protein Alo02nite_53610 [Actinoplanes lobatus]
MLWIGTSGWRYRDWRPEKGADATGFLCPAGLPQRAWLGQYAEAFATVEVNCGGAVRRSAGPTVAGGRSPRSGVPRISDIYGFTKEPRNPGPVTGGRR